MPIRMIFPFSIKYKYDENTNIIFYEFSTTRGVGVTLVMGLFFCLFSLLLSPFPWFIAIFIGLMMSLWLYGANAISSLIRLSLFTKKLNKELNQIKLSDL
jgi:hypothetical protein